ncbi:phosphoglycerate mutase family protein [Pseudoalteromonas piscicida]|uniref:SixA phosphatase family protein n=1 Tax=Pseudoalteromonas piscicida TaxID=43662 RepID=UPI0030A2C642
MKTLRLLRHAKSSWKDLTVDDVDRPLKAKGQKRCSLLAKTLGELPTTQIHSSHAKRALQTADIIAKACCDSREVTINKAFYTFEIQALYTALCSLPSDANDVLLVAHNPALLALVNWLTELNFENIVTAGYVELACDVSCWGQLSPKNCRYIRHIFLK